MKTLRKLHIEYFTGPLFILGGIVWLINGNIRSGVCFLIAGVIFCWVGYAHYKEPKKGGE